MTRVEWTAAAAGDLYLHVKRHARAGREVHWAPLLARLTNEERERARGFVSAIITYECSAPGYSPAERALLRAMDK